MDGSRSLTLKAVIIMAFGIALVVSSFLVMIMDVSLLLLVLRVTTFSWMLLLGLALILISYKLITLRPPPPQE